MTAQIFKLHPYQQQAIDALNARWADRRDYAEASFFDGYHFQHIADWLDFERLRMIERDVEAYRRRHPRIAELWK